MVDYESHFTEECFKFFMKQKRLTPIDECRIQYQQLSAELVKVNTKLDSILNVGVNGTVGLENALQELYDVTSGSEQARN